MLTQKLIELYERTIEAVFGFMLCLILIGIGIGAVKLLADLWELLSSAGITGHYLDLIADILTLYVLVELSRSLFEYFHSKKMRLTFIVDAAIVFIIRELLIGLFKHNLDPSMIYALSALIFSLGALRIGSAVVHHKTAHPKKEQEQPHG
ncbi:phosphate-starvation-inducible PsiE family protein [Neptuniibacter halophilus]|uniref:phosphate-starvation-inducible PsiE family protein n=1 Tax=Neptuniibacter halophilus TaxID=651666 RepID=UPI0025741C65|nr:phosphate-starvation-inducible PsiE family protein [Neptuniibacter halophilus]